jgi:hypothetical protein
MACGIDKTGHLTLLDDHVVMMDGPKIVETERAYCGGAL